MQRPAVAVEEQLIQKAIREECSWENLPKRLQATLTSKDEWHRRIVEHCVKKRLQWNKCFARKVCKEGEYYEEMMRYLRKNLALFPYHLAEYVCRVMRVSPFRYYCEILFEVMKNEQPYDSIPNFSAADALRLTGIGRNEFIDIMNKCRSKKIMWKLNKSIAKELLPVQPVDFAIESWWGVCLVNFTLEEFKKLSEEEMTTIDKICKEEGDSYILFDPNVIKGLYQRGLIYFDVAVHPDDRFKVSRLEGFVSNREQLYEDPIEELLYAVFVVSSENATVAELATTLQADLFQLQAAASFACRLGWAVKYVDPGSFLQDTRISVSSKLTLIDDEDARAHLSSANVLCDDDVAQQEDSSDAFRLRMDHARVAFIVDANITSYLMMGSVSPGLKSHAVTLYEAGKLGHASIADLCRDLTTLEGAKFEGELQEFANHAFSLRCILECLLSGGVDIAKQVEVCRKMEMVSLESHAQYRNGNEDGASELCCSEMHQSVPLVKLETGLDKVQGVSTTTSGPGNTLVANKDNGMVVDKLNPGQDSDVKNEFKMQRREYQVDILRCESLGALAPSTLERLFLRDYDIVMSMVPLPLTAVLPGPKGPIHFGPPSHSFLTPWMKLVLYSTAAIGPLSVVLMKGQCLRLLPAPLAGCEKALIYSWDGSTVGGLGSKFEGNLVKGSVLLHCINSLLKYSAVLVQPLSRRDLDKSGRIVTMDIPLPLADSDDLSSCLGEELGFSTEESLKLSRTLVNLGKTVNLSTIGYIRLIKLFTEKESAKFVSDDCLFEWVPLSIEFGIPLFSPNLCRRICRRVISSGLLQSGSLVDHHGVMENLRKNLKDICAEYQATGHAAKIIYQKEKPKESSRKLMNYASGRWNPLVDPSSPISGAASENQRLKLCNRQRCKTEVLSFDGSILRSYALPPVYEASNSQIEEASLVNPAKVDSNEADAKEVVFPGVNLIFDGAELHPFDIGACHQARQPIALITEATGLSAKIESK